MRKFFIKTMGCKANQLEGALIKENLLNQGFAVTQNLHEADFFVLNSCTVTHKSDNEAFSILSRAKKNNAGIITVLTGCIAQVEKENLLKNENIDIVLGNDEKLNISKYLADKFCVSDIMEKKEFSHVFVENTEKTRASLKIQDGCDNRCSYCIIPFARGRNRSADLDFILKQIKHYEDAGFKEIVLTGIHIGQWGQDLTAKKDLFFLLEQIEEKTSIPRYRLGSLNPLELDDKILEFLKNSEKFCPHFHLSLQSMCNNTLKAMNRHYSVEQSLDLIEKIAQEFYLPFIGSDIIAGFVAESEEDFLTTVKNLEKSKLSQIHTFPYSIRKNTIAEKMSGHLEKRIKDYRASVIKEISAKKFESFVNSNQGSIQEVLIEKNLDKKSGYFKGVSKNYLNVLIKPTDVNAENIKKTIQKVRIVNSGMPIYGEIV